MEHDLAFHPRNKSAEPERRAAQPAQLLLQTISRERLGPGLLQRDDRLDLAGVPDPVIDRDGEREPRATMSFDPDRSAKTDLPAFEGLPDTLFQCRIAGFPEAVARMDAPEIDIAGSEA